MAGANEGVVELGGHLRLDRALPPCALVIFGGAGDLSRRKLIPALYNIFLDHKLGQNFAILAFSMEDLDDDSYRELARKGIEEHSRRPLTAEGWRGFAPLLHYTRGRFTEPGDYQKLKKTLAELDRQYATGGDHAFYFAIPPDFIDSCSAGLKEAGMITRPQAGRSFTRVVIEKPAGHDLASASEINDRLARYFEERQIFRIDHYLGKETVENLMVLRFANAVFEPLWSARFIDHVQITVAEQDGVGSRGGYYEGAGALRDMVQSHLLSLLCMIAMEPPWTTEAEAVRDAKLDVLRSLHPLEPEDVAQWVVRGQYSEGLVAGEKVTGYRQEDRIAPDSAVETFVALRCFVENWRWAGVPFYLRTGKRMPKRATEIAIQFNALPRILFNARPRAPLPPNVLIIRIQPDEGLALSIISRIAGEPVRLSPINVDFHFKTESPDAYETLLCDVMLGDQTLFMRRDTVEAAWRFVQNIRDAWAAAPAEPAFYGAGSWGPVEAALMIAADRRSWRVF